MPCQHATAALHPSPPPPLLFPPPTTTTTLYCSYWSVYGLLTAAERPLDRLLQW